MRVGVGAGLAERVGDAVAVAVGVRVGAAVVRVGEAVTVGVRLGVAVGGREVGGREVGAGRYVEEVRPRRGSRSQAMPSSGPGSSSSRCGSLRSMSKNVCASSW
ncbi:hypothetical protein SALBM217S_04895 [Streptomyces griseoloalbus]